MEYNIDIDISSLPQLDKLFGNFDENIEIIKDAFNVSVLFVGGQLKIVGKKCDAFLAEEAINKLICLVSLNEPIDVSKVSYITELVKAGIGGEIDELISSSVGNTSHGKTIKCKNVAQKLYVDKIKNNTITFSVGPAGTGKTYLAVAVAATLFKHKRIDKIILTRPAVEAGEKLGFLPGDLAAKVDPYLRPLFDALSEMFGLEAYARYLEKGAIEIAPLAYMRGRTLSNAFIILDEAQNTTKEQMKMFLTRLGENSKMVVTGDVTQIDLKAGETSGLIHATEVLKEIKDIAVVHFTHKDVVRHKLVMDIVEAYEKVQNNKSL